MNSTLEKRSKSAVDFGLLVVLLVFHLAAFTSLWQDAHPGVLSSVAIVVMFFINIKILIYFLFRSYNFLFWVFYGSIIFSLLNYLFNAEVQTYASQHSGTLSTIFSYLVLPPFFFYLVGNTIGEKGEQGEFILEKVIFISLGCIAISISLYVTMPPFYVDYLLSTFRSNLSILARMHGYFGNSMLLGVICSTTLPLAFGLKRSPLVRTSMMTICLIGSVLSMQRGSWAASALMLLLIMGYTLLKRGIKALIPRPKFLMVGVALAALLSGTIAVNLDYLDPVLSNMDSALLDRDLSSVTSAFSDRNSQWRQIEDILGDHPFGMGIGMLSHVTASQGFERAIPDGNYFRILGELGLIGFLAFLGLLGGGILLAFRYKLPYIAFALIAYAAQGVGTNVFDFYYSSFILWLLLGLVFARAGHGLKA